MVEEIPLLKHIQPPHMKDTGSDRRSAKDRFSFDNLELVSVSSQDLTRKLAPIYFYSIKREMMRLLVFWALLVYPVTAIHSKPFATAPIALLNRNDHATVEAAPISETTSLALLGLRGGETASDFVGTAYDWCINLGAPAALVAGAVVATLYENIRGGQLETFQGDTTYVKVAKKMTSMLLLSAFALQIVSIFVTTVTGTMLLSGDFSETETTAKTGLGFLREHFEFEYLTSRLSFLQGLLNWLAGVALEHTIPRKGEGRAARHMDLFVASSLSTLVILLLSFYNAHMTFYDNYFQMVTRWFHVTVTRYTRTFRPLMFLYIPGFLFSVVKGYQALNDNTYSQVRDEGP